MRRKISSVFLLVLCCSFIANLALKPDWEINQKGSLVAVDALGYSYQINQSKVTKYTPKGKFKVDYNNLLYGNIVSVDARNALKPLLFYKEQQKLVLLDNMLGETNTIDLTDYFEWIDLACLSNRDNAFWLYSITDQSLVKADENLETTNRFDNVGQLLSMELTPTQLFEKNELVYLFDSNFGVVVFDIFGNYKKKIPLKNATKVWVEGEELFYLNGNCIESFNMKSFENLPIYCSQYKVVDFCISNSSLYLQGVEKLTRYQLK